MEKIKKLKIKMQIVNGFTNVNGVGEYIDNRLKKKYVHKRTYHLKR